MLFRFLVYVLLQAAGGTAGYALAAWPGALAGAVLAGLAWFTVDLSRGVRLIAWLRRSEGREAPTLGGLWGEAADRMRRLLRGQDRKMQESDQRLQEFLAAIQASPNGVVLLDAQGRIEWCNQTAAGHFGFDAQRDMLQHIGNLVRDPVFAAYYAGNDYRHEVAMPGRDQTPSRPVRLSVHIHPYGHGRKLLLSRDITAVAQAEAMRRDFVANVSHEIRTPLTVLAGFIETLQTLPLDEAERERYLTLMAAQAGRMQSLVNDLLTLSRLDGSPPPSATQWVLVVDLTAQCEEEARALSSMLFSPSAAPQALSFEAPEGWALAGSSSELRSAMSNLINNAVRYTPAGGRIDVTWRLLADGRAEFAVTDTGPGIAPEHLSRLSERFYRVDRSRSRESGGTGLGLAIAKHVAQRHGGELRFASTVGKGSRFALLLPASRVRAEASPVAPVSA